MRCCSICGVVKDDSQFYRNRTYSSGYHSYCKVCFDRKIVERRHQNPEEERLRQLRSQEQHADHHIANSRAYRASHPGKDAARHRLDRIEHPEKYRARELVQHALEGGTLMRPSACPTCERVIQVQAHHKDYSRPLDVTWLCQRCHSRTHAGLPSLLPALTAPKAEGVRRG